GARVTVVPRGAGGNTQTSAASRRAPPSTSIAASMRRSCASSSSQACGLSPAGPAAPSRSTIITDSPTASSSPCSRETASVNSADGDAGRTIITVAAWTRPASHSSDATTAKNARRTTTLLRAVGQALHQDRLTPQCLGRVRPAWRARQVGVVVGQRACRAARAQFLDAAEQEQGIQRARGIRKAPPFGEQRRPRQIDATPVPGGVGQRQQILAGGGLQHGVAPVTINLNQDLVPAAGGQQLGPAPRLRSTG